MYKVKKLALASHIMLAGLTIVAYLSRLVDPGSAGIISMLGLFYPAMMVCHGIMFCGWLILGPRRYVLISLVFLLLELYIFNNWFQFSIAEANAPKPALTVGTLNLQFGKELSTLPSDQHNQYESLASHLKELDILCVQEHGSFNERYINFPYQHLLPYQYVGILSNHPIIDKGTVSSSFNSANNCLWADILYQEDTIRVYGVHLESNRHDGMIPTFVDQQNEETYTTTGYLGILMHYLRFSSMRRDQAMDIRKHQLATHHPSIIAGDFNDVPLSAMYHIISAGLTDTFIERGCGSGNTLRTLIPGLRIDYILTTPQWKVYDHNIEEATYSDHYLVTARLKLREYKL